MKLIMMRPSKDLEIARHIEPNTISGSMHKNSRFFLTACPRGVSTVIYQRICTTIKPQHTRRQTPLLSAHYSRTVSRPTLVLDVVDRHFPAVYHKIAALQFGQELHSFLIGSSYPLHICPPRGNPTCILSPSLRACSRVRISSS